MALVDDAYADLIGWRQVIAAIWHGRRVGHADKQAGLLGRRVGRETTQAGLLGRWQGRENT